MWKRRVHRIPVIKHFKNQLEHKIFDDTVKTTASLTSQVKVRPDFLSFCEHATNQGNKAK